MSGDNHPTEDSFSTREKIRVELLQSNTAVGVVLAIVLALALALVITGARATRNQQRAESAEAASTERLWNSYLAEANALRLTYTAGRRQRALTVISNAAAIHTALELRTEAAAALALTDLIREPEFGALPQIGEAMDVDVERENFAYGNTQGVVAVARLRNRSEIITLDGRPSGKGFASQVQNIGFSPDGTMLTVRHIGGALAVWDLAKRQMIFGAGTNETKQTLAGMIFSPDSRTLFFSDPDRDKQITQYDMVTQTRVKSGLKVGARMFRFRPGTSQVAVIKDNKVELFDYPTDVVLRTLELTSRAYVIGWSPDGAQLAASGEDGDVHLWNLQQETHRILRGHSEPCMRLGFSPDSRLIFTGSRDGTTRLWDSAQGLLLATASDGMGHTFFPDGNRLGYMRFSPVVGSWLVKQSDCFSTLFCPQSDGPFNGMDLSTDGRWCVAAQGKGFRIWDLSSGAKETFFPVSELNAVRVAPDCKSLFVCRGSALERWPFAESGATNGAAFGPVETIALPNKSGARNIAISLNGTTAAVELMDLRFVTIDLAGTNPPVIFPERWRFINQRGPASPTGPGRFAISPDGRWIVTGYWLGPKDVPRVWDARTATVVTNVSTVSSLAGYSPDGKWLALCSQGEYQIYSTADWKLVKKIQRDEYSFTHGSLAFVGNSGDVALTRTRQQLQLRAGDSDEKYLDLIPPAVQSISTVRVSTDGKVLATGTARDIIHIWRLDQLRASLDRMNLGWHLPPAAPVTAAIPTSGRLESHALLTFGGAGFVLVALLSVFAIKRHRTTIGRFFAAEAKAAEHNRALEGARMELMQSQKMKALGTLAAGIAHDFNNLLSVIRMSNKLIGRSVKDDPDVQENVADIEQAVMQGKSVVGSMLGYARSESEPSELVDVCSVVEETVSLLSKEFLSGIVLTLELDRHAPWVHIARGQVEQVLLNLVVNASEAMHGKGKLKVSVKQRTTPTEVGSVLRPASAPQFVELAVSDSGPGIPPEIRDRLFEPFFTTKRGGAKAGTGLGLSLVYSIAEKEKLGLNVESEPGRGAAFLLSIPVRDIHSSQDV
jgi:signal transduction histidine kinase